MENARTCDQEKLVSVAQAIARAMGHEERWRTYTAVARMHLAGYAACRDIEQAEKDTTHLINKKARRR